MSRELIQTEQELLDYIDLPEVEPGRLKFIFNEQKKQIDLECIFADGKGLFYENIQQIAVNTPKMILIAVGILSVFIVSFA